MATSAAMTRYICVREMQFRVFFLYLRQCATKKKPPAGWRPLECVSRAAAAWRFSKLHGSFHPNTTRWQFDEHMHTLYSVRALSCNSFRENERTHASRGNVAFLMYTDSDIHSCPIIYFWDIQSWWIFFCLELGSFYIYVISSWIFNIYAIKYQTSCAIMLLFISDAI